MKSLIASRADSDEIGYFRTFVRPPGGHWREITVFRGAPTVLNSCSTADPFSDQTANLTLQQVTVFDTPGQGDLDWLVADADVNIVWENTGSYEFSWRWEGYVASYDFSLEGTDTSFTIDLKGALYALDDYKAKPTYPSNPIPYEVLIERAFKPEINPARLSPLKVTFPSDWTTVVPDAYNDLPEYFWFLKPEGVTTGQKWSGLTSRSTGAWEPMLTGFVQSLLSVMFDEGNSQWTIQNRGYRRPEMFLRRVPTASDPEILEVTLGAPGVGFSGSKDFTQMTNTIYGTGTDQTGVQYNGVQISSDGQTTTYRPFAYQPQVYPRQDNPQLNPNLRAKEMQLKFQDGLDEITAKLVAQTQLQRFGEPGIMGSLTLTSDPRTQDGEPFPRMLIKAGRSIRVKGLFGSPEGIIFHITQTSADFNALSVTLTIDSKYRDALTVEEVKARTRDALDPVRMLQVGKYSNLVPDLIMPWDYSAGSGVFPSGGGAGGLDATNFFREMPPEIQFPWTEWTTKYPPSKYPQYYARIGPTARFNSTKNWASVPSYESLNWSNFHDWIDGGLQIIRLPIRMRMSQAGTIRLSQVAAYDKNGNVMPVKFHFSIYKVNGAGPDAMPAFHADPETTGIAYRAPWHDDATPPVTVNYKAYQTNPFIKDGWETVNEDGSTVNEGDEPRLARQGAEMVVGWGNYYEPAGYWPGRASRGATRTGMLSDTTQWSWQDERVTTFDPEGAKKEEDAGMMFVNVFCDEQGDQPVYFLGRFFRVEPGQQ